MISANREEISDALLARLQSATFSTPLGVNSATTWANNNPTARRFKLFSDVGINDQPALFLVAHDEETTQKGPGIPSRRSLMYSAICYCRAEQGDVGDTFINVMLTAIEQVLAPQPGFDIATNIQTLGGLVYKCWIKGKIFRDPGDIDNQAMLIVPIEVMLP